MRRRNSRSEFVTLLLFLGAGVLVITNGFSSHIFAEEDDDLYSQIAPISEVLSHIMNDYVNQPDIDRAVEHAINGMMQSLDRNSSYIPPEGFTLMQEETEGAFDGIGVQIRLRPEDSKIIVFEPIAGAPAAIAGIRAGDIIAKVDGVSTEGMDLNDVANRIKGPRGRTVNVTVIRTDHETGETEELSFDVQRGKIPLESIVEGRMLDGGIGYVRVSDFKKNTATDLRERIEEFKENGITALILDLRWNPGGLLTASKDVCEIFLPRNTLVVSTKGRTGGDHTEDMTLNTSKSPVVPESMPVIVLTSGTTASSSEIVTGALQFHQRALIVGERTFGKGSVQTIIPLRRPEGAALRLTTALYYTPADVTIDHVGILPDVEVEMSLEDQEELRIQMIRSFEEDASLRNAQNHGSITGNAVTDETIEDVVLARAVELLKEEPVFTNLIKKYHKDPKETQVAAIESQAEPTTAEARQQ